MKLSSLLHPEFQNCIITDLNCFKKNSCTSKDYTHTKRLSNFCAFITVHLDSLLLCVWAVKWYFYPSKHNRDGLQSKSIIAYLSLFAWLNYYHALVDSNYYTYKKEHFHLLLVSYTIKLSRCPLTRPQVMCVDLRDNINFLNLFINARIFLTYLHAI
jgi:hypothetical protein